MTDVAAGVAPLEPRSVAIGYERVISALVLALSFLAGAAILYHLGLTSNDSGEYAGLWARARGTPFFSAWAVERIEGGSMFVYWALSQVLSQTATFYTVGLVAFAVQTWLIWRYLNYWWLAWLLYASLFLFLHDANQVRVALSTCFVIYALIGAPSRRGFVLSAVAAGAFHYSGLIILALFLVARPVIGLASLWVFAAGWDYVIRANRAFFAIGFRYLSSDAATVSLKNSNFLAQLVVCAVCAYRWPRLTEAQRRGAYFLMIGAVAYLAFFHNPIMAHRLRELSVLGVFPVLFLGSRKVTDSSLVILACVLYLAVYSVVEVASR